MIWDILEIFAIVRACVRACVHACVHTHRPSFVCWTCLRVLAGSTWNLFRSTIYELKLCTSYFWSASVRSFVCERRRNLGPDSIWQFQVIFFQCFVLNSSDGFGRINVKPIQIEYILVEVVHLPLGAMSVHPFVCERCRNLGPHNILLIRVFFFQCSLLNLSWGFSRINLKPLQIEYIWVGVVHLPLGAASHRPFFYERGQNLSPYSILMI